MPITTIPWGDGSGDNIYLSAPSQTGDQSVSVTSDPNTGAARSKVVTFNAVGVTPVSLTINQAAGTPTPSTFSGHPTSYDQDDHSYYSLSNVSNGYADSDSTNYASIRAKNGDNAETWIYFKFDTSSIPNNATILSVSCSVKVTHNANNTIFPTRTIQMYSGSTPKGSATSFTTSTSERTLDVGVWTRAELEDARIKLYLQRGTTQSSTAYYGRFYGATLTIEYTI